MRSFSFKGKAQRVSRPTLFLGAVVVLMMILTACGTTTTPATTSGPDLITPGTLTVGSDTTYPPQEFIDTATGKATGFDVDLITAIATKMGLKVKIVTTGFDTIIDSHPSL